MFGLIKSGGNKLEEFVMQNISLFSININLETAGLNHSDFGFSFLRKGWKNESPEFLWVQTVVAILETVDLGINFKCIWIYHLKILQNTVGSAVLIQMAFLYHRITPVSMAFFLCLLLFSTNIRVWTRMVDWR